MTDEEKGAAVVQYLARLEWDAPPTITLFRINGLTAFVRWTAKLNGIEFGCDIVWGKEQATPSDFQAFAAKAAAETLEQINARFWKEKLCYSSSSSSSSSSPLTADRTT